MPTETKNSTAKASRSGSVSSAARWLSGDSLRIMPAKKAPSAKETPNRLAARKATPSATASTASRNSSREPVWATQCSTQGMTRRPTMSMKAMKARTLARVRPSTPQRPRSNWRRQRHRRARARAVQRVGDGRDQDQRQHHGEILDDQPADRDPALLGLDQAALLQRAQQHHGARDRQRQAEDDARHPGPAEEQAQPHAQQRRDADLHQGAGHRDRLDREQILQREMQADAEHQQDDADLGELVGEVLIGDEARA